jgi:hypothetical protein
MGGNALPDATGSDPQAFILLRTNGDPITLIAAAQAAVWLIDCNQAIASIRTVPELLAPRELNRWAGPATRVGIERNQDI